MIAIYPAIDIIGGRCVRLSQGDFARTTTYAELPEDMVRRYADCGVQRIHAVDLDGARGGQPANLRTLERMATVCDVPIEWGGGLKDEAALHSARDAGAAYTVVGSIAARHPERFSAWLTRDGGESLVLGADVHNGRIAVSGWAEALPTTIDDLLDRFAGEGLREAVCTDIARDGMLGGPSFDLYARLQEKYPAVRITVSGGIATMDDVRRLNDMGLHSVIVGKAIYEGRITLREIAQWEAQR